MPNGRPQAPGFPVRTVAEATRLFQERGAPLEAPVGPVEPIEGVEARIRARLGLPGSVTPTTELEERIRGRLQLLRGRPLAVELGMAAPGESEAERIARVARAEGISLAGAPAAARAAAALAPQEATSGREREVPLRAARVALSRLFERPVETRLGPTGAVEFRDPRTGGFTVFNPPGFEVAELGALLSGEGRTILGGVTGALGGQALGFPVLGESLGAGVGEFLRLKRAQQLELLEPGLSDQRLAIMATERAGLPTAAAGLLLRFGAHLAPRVLAPVEVGRLRTLETQLSRDQADAVIGAIDDAERIAREIRARTGEEFGFTAGQATSSVPAAAELFVTERALIQKGKVGQPLRDIVDDQNEVLVGLLEKARIDAGLPADPLGPSAAGQLYRSKMQAMLGRIDERLSGRLALREEPLRTRLDALYERAQRFDPSTYGADLKAVRAREATVARELEREAYNAADEYAERIGVGERVPEHFFAAAQELTELERQNILGSISELDRTILREALESPRFRTTKDPETGKVLERRMSLGQMSATISRLRARLRDVELGHVSGVEPGMLRRLLGALKRDRQALIGQSPDLAAMIDQADLMVRLTRDQLDRSVIGDIARLRGGREVVLDEDVFDRIFQPGAVEGPRAVARLLKSPRGELTVEEGQLYADVWERVRDGLLDRYQRSVARVTDRGERILRIPQHRAFLRDHEAALRAFFSPEEVTEIGKLGGLERVAAVHRQNRDAILRMARESPEGRVAGLGRRTGAVRPEDAIERAFRRNDLPLLRRILARTEGDPVFRESVRSVIYADLMESIRPSTVGGIARVDLTKLPAWVAGHEEALRMVFGPQYTKDLITVGSAVETMTRQSPSELARREPTGSATRHLIRIWTGMFRARGRAYTAINIARSKAAERALVKLLADPQGLRRALTLTKSRLWDVFDTPGVAATVGTLLMPELDGAIGLTAAGGLATAQALGSALTEQGPEALLPAEP